MKSLASYLAFALVSTAAFAQNSGAERTIGPVHSIVSNGSININVTEGSSNTLRIDADQDVLDKIEVEYSEGRLVVGLKQGVKMNWKGKSPVVSFQVKELRNLMLNGSGNFTATGNFSAPKEFNIAGNGSGNCSIGSITTNEANVALQGSGNFTIQGGKVAECNISMSGSGNVNTGAMQAGEVNVMIQGSGNATVQASDELNAVVRGSGKVRYSGTAKVTTTNASSVTKL